MLDQKFIVFLTLFFFDHSFTDGSNTSDANFEFFKLLKFFEKFVLMNKKKDEEVKLNAANDSVGYKGFICSKIFEGLSKSIEA